MRMGIQRLDDGTTEVDIKMLPDGRACVHWLQECDDGPITIVGHPRLRRVQGRPEVGKYRLVCNPKQTTVNPQKRGNVRFVCMVTGDIAAVTCPACIASEALQKALMEQADSKDQGAAEAAAAVFKEFDKGANKWQLQ